MITKKDTLVQNKIIGLLNDGLLVNIHCESSEPENQIIDHVAPSKAQIFSGEEPEVTDDAEIRFSLYHFLKINSFGINVIDVTRITWKQENIHSLY